MAAGQKVDTQNGTMVTKTCGPLVVEFYPYPHEKRQQIGLTLPAEGSSNLSPRAPKVLIPKNLPEGWLLAVSPSSLAASFVVEVRGNATMWRGSPDSCMRKVQLPLC